MKIGTNTTGLSSLRTLATTTRLLARAMERLASGKRINSARDDAAGLAIGNGLEARHRGLLQALKNVNASRSYLLTLDSYAQTQTEIVHRLGELALQSANGILSNDHRSYLDNEFQSLLQEFDRLGKMATQYGLSTLPTHQRLQVGPSARDTLTLSLNPLERDLTEAQNFGTGTFRSVATIATGDEPLFPQLADLDDDGNLDMVIAQFSTSTIEIRMGNGNGTFRSANLATGTGNVIPLIADFNDDGILDVASAHRSNAWLSVHLGNGNGTFQSARTAAVNAESRGMASGDFNGDGKVDLAVAEFGAAGAGSTLAVLFGNGNGTFSPKTTYATRSSPYLISTGDFNEDGTLDLIVDTNVGPDVFLGSSSGAFSAGVQLSVTGAGSSGLLTFDINDDGFLDIMRDDVSNATVSYWFGNGNGTFQSANTIAAGSSPHGLAAADLDGDDYLDLVWTNTATATTRIALANGNGTFGTPTTLVASTVNRAVAVGDLDGDGANDLITGYYGDDQIGIYLGIARSEEMPLDWTIDNQSSAEEVLENIADLLDSVSSYRAQIGSTLRRLDFTTNNLESMAISTASAQSQLMDADLAEEVAETLRLQILQQLGISALSAHQVNAKLTLEVLSSLKLRF